ncbi:MAG: insulinase family protein [Bacteroidales bacterium]|nr:insulinase family protein [Bacteroidales bacterium]
MKNLVTTSLKLSLIFVFSILLSCDINTKQGFKIDYEKYVLENGLEVVLHEDHSDPIVAVATLMHVGSNREVKGKTGFAHFFEHMSFNDSENVPRGANRKVIPEWGGMRNGGTWSDGTIYYEVVPTDAFEKILWIDSDRLGYMINTVTDEALEREKQVVKNEKRQNYDNVAYGYTSEVIKSNLYPENHPYNWTVIGSLPDLQAANLDDVKEFYNKFYGANNATLVIAGDINIEETKELVNKWFGEIRKAETIESLKPMPVTLEETKSLFHEDNFARLPELRMVFPTVESYNDDSYALDVLAEILSGNKKSPLYKIIVEEKKLAPSVTTYQSSDELAGEFAFIVRANANTDLDEVKLTIEEGLASFEANSFTDNDLNRVKAQIETGLYQGISTALDKAFQLATYNEYAGDPGYITLEAEKMQSVSREDIIRVYNKYIKDKKYIMTSFVPKGQLDLIVEGAKKAEIWVEPNTATAEHEKVSQGKEAEYEKTKTKHDRSEPEFGELPLFSAPQVWKDKLANGIEIYGIENSEVPLVNFDITIKGGHWLDSFEKSGTANLLSSLLKEGTQNRTPEELEEAIDLLGASIDIYAGTEDLVIEVSCLSKNFESTLKLVEEILLEPRWDEKEFIRIKSRLETGLKGMEANSRFISGNIYKKLLYGENHILGKSQYGTLETLSDINLDDLKDYYNKNLAPNISTFHLVGDVKQERIKKALNSFETRWSSKDVVFPEYELPKNTLGRKVFFVDIPGSKQSIIRAGYVAISKSDDDFNNLDYANEILGGGSSGRLFQLLRIEKGFTYGAYSFLESSLEKGPFTAYTSVRSNATLESLQLIKDLIGNYAVSFGENEMEITKTKLIKENTRAYESLGAKLGILHEMSKYGYSGNYLVRNQQELLEMNLVDFRNMINKYIDESQMLYFIVGDAKSELQNVNKFGYGKATMLDIFGNEID